MQELVQLEQMPAPEVPNGWAFKEADKDFDAAIYEWRRLTIHVLAKAYVFYLVLAMPGKRMDLSPNGERLPTWSEWTDLKGIGINTLTRHFKELGWPVIEKPKQIKSFPLSEEKYRIIYADPPWMYTEDGLTGVSNKDTYGNVDKFYPQLSIEELCTLPVSNLIGDEAVLFLWVTSPFLEKSFRIIEAWGFDYKTSFVWDKVKHNFGYYNSVRHELLLVCTKGSCRPDIPELTDSVVTLERTEVHSQKPEYFRELIDKLYPYGKRIELFARTKAPNWEVWGNEI